MGQPGNAVKNGALKDRALKNEPETSNT